ncbi:hypothetical protein BH20VER1_BH20VER1_05360 [soil metagenome]
MLRLPLIALVLLLVPLLTAAEKPARLNPPYQRAQSTDPQEGWSQESAGKDVVIHSRTRPGSSLREFRAIGVIEAAPGAVFAVIDDSESYPRFMPYTSETRVLKREKDTVLAYQRLELPLVSDRDYTLRSRHQRWLSPEGPIYWIRWQPANDQGPPQKPGVLRVNVCEGGWLLEPHESGATRAIYTIYTDSGGALPAVLANNGSRIAIRKVFEAIRKQVKNPKYAAATAAAPAAVEARNRSGQ